MHKSTLYQNCQRSIHFDTTSRVPHDRWHAAWPSTFDIERYDVAVRDQEAMPNFNKVSTISFRAPRVRRPIHSKRHNGESEEGSRWAKTTQFSTTDTAQSYFGSVTPMCEPARCRCHSDAAYCKRRCRQSSWARPGISVPSDIATSNHVVVAKERDAEVHWVRYEPST